MKIKFSFSFKIKQKYATSLQKETLLGIPAQLCHIFISQSIFMNKKWTNQSSFCLKEVA